MISETELCTLLSTLNYPVAYDHFTSKEVSLPFILYRNTDSSSFKADDKSYIVGKNYIVDLATAIKDPTIESGLETIFNNNNLPYDKTEDYIESEKIYQIRYFI